MAVKMPDDYCEPQAGSLGLTMKEVETEYLDDRIIIYDSVTDGNGTEWALKPIVMRAGPSILVVGPDGVGKTTVVSRLNEITRIPTFKCPSEKEIFFSGGASSLSFDMTMTHFIQQTGLRYISDRAYPCEWVYSRVFSRDTNGVALGKIDDRHRQIGTRILYLYSSEQPTQEDDIVPSDKYWEVKETYDDFCEWTECKVTAVDTASMIAAYRGGGDISLDFTKCIMALMGDIF